MVSDIRFLNTASAPTRAASPASAPAAASAAEPRDAVTLAPSAPPARAAAASATADKAAPSKPDYAPGQVLVKFDSTTPTRAVSQLAERFGLQTVRHFDVPPQMAQKFGGELYQFKLREGDSVEDAIKRLSTQPGVTFAEPNYLIHIDDPKTSRDAAFVQDLQQKASEVVPNDLDPRLWGIKNTGQDGGTAGVDVGATEAWKTTTGAPNGQGPLLCVIDTGIDYRHPDLAANVWTNPGEVAGDGIDNDGNGYVDDVHGFNLVNDTGDPLDDQGHGTHCSGTIAGVGNNGTGVVGVNWNATVAGAKFLDANGSGTYADAIEAVLYATAIGARVTSNSWGGGGFSQALYDAFKSSPALHICAAGNESNDVDSTPSYPGGFDLDNIVSVAAIDRNGQLADFSNYGAQSVDVAAPGVDVYSTVPNNGYESLSGTSMATPHVTGVAGLILSQYPDISNEQLKSRLMNSSVKMDELSGKTVSGGRVNAGNALENDAVAPSTISDLSVVDRGATGITLGFTATGDDGNVGRAASYQVRYSTQPIIDEDSWNAASVARNLPTPGESGAAEQVRVALAPEAEAKTYHFALKAVDNMGNASEMATTSGTTEPAHFAFVDDFETDNGSWKSSGGWGRVTDGEHGVVFEDSPGTVYPSSAKSTLTSGPISLANVKNPQLIFSEKHELEAGYDNVHVMVSTDGRKYDTLESFSGRGDWTNRTIDLKAYEGKTVRVRFKLTSDTSVSYEGVSIDNVKIMGDRA